MSRLVLPTWLDWRVLSSRKTGRENRVLRPKEASVFARLPSDAITVVRTRRSPVTGNELLTVEIPVVRLDDVLGVDKANELMSGLKLPVEP